MGCRICPGSWLTGRTVRLAARKGSLIRLMLFRRLEQFGGSHASTTRRTRNGQVEQMRVLMVARRSARDPRHLVFTAPESIRVRFKDRYKTGLVTEAANMRPRKGSEIHNQHGSGTSPDGSENEIDRTSENTAPSTCTESEPTPQPELLPVTTQTASTIGKVWAHLCGVTHPSHHQAK